MNEDLLPDEWWARLPDAEANKVIQVAKCLIQLRLMSLERKASDLLLEMQKVERTSRVGKEDIEVITDISNEYSEAVNGRKRLMSKEGQLEFIEEMLTAYYERKKQDRDVLPL